MAMRSPEITQQLIDEDPAGSIFLPETVRDVDRVKFEMLLGRGAARGMDTTQMIAYGALLDQQRSRLTGDESINFQRPHVSDEQVSSLAS